MITFDIHAGITDKEIIEMLEENGLLEGFENNLKKKAPKEYEKLIAQYKINLAKKRKIRKEFLSA